MEEALGIVEEEAHNGAEREREDDLEKRLDDNGKNVHSANVYRLGNTE